MEECPQGIERDSSECSSGFLLRHSRNSENGKKRALQSGFAAGGIVPLLQRMRPAPAAASADGDGVDSEGQRNIRVRRGTLDARPIADKIIGGEKRGQQG